MDRFNYNDYMRAYIEASKAQPKYPPGGPASVGGSDGPEYAYQFQYGGRGHSKSIYEKAADQMFGAHLDWMDAEVVPPPQSATEFMEQMKFPKPVQPKIMPMGKTPSPVIIGKGGSTRGLIQKVMRECPGLITKLTPSKVMQGDKSIILWS